jgi:nicotinamide mononucleotide (NMN) deamidase PncC
MQTVRQSCQGVSVTDVALSFSGWTSPAGHSDAPPKFEGTLYLVWKRKD